MSAGRLVLLFHFCFAFPLLLLLSLTDTISFLPHVMFNVLCITRCHIDGRSHDSTAFTLYKID